MRRELGTAGLCCVMLVGACNSDSPKDSDGPVDTGAPCGGEGAPGGAILLSVALDTGYPTVSDHLFEIAGNAEILVDHRDDDHYQCNPYADHETTVQAFGLPIGWPSCFAVPVGWTCSHVSSEAIDTASCVDEGARDACPELVCDGESSPANVHFGALTDMSLNLSCVSETWYSADIPDTGS